MRERVNTQRHWRFHNCSNCAFLILAIVLCTWVAVYVAPCRNTDDEKHKLISAANDFCCTLTFIYSEIGMLLCMCKLKSLIAKSDLSAPLFSSSILSSFTSSTLTTLPSASSMNVTATTTANTNLSNSTSRYKSSKANVVNGHNYCYHDANRLIASTWSVVKERTTFVLFSLSWLVTFIFGISVICTQVYFIALALLYITYVINSLQIRQSLRFR